jgi:hypothetical protein
MIQLETAGLARNYRAGPQGPGQLIPNTDAFPAGVAGRRETTLPKNIFP